MQPDTASNLQAMAIELLSEKEQETTRLLALALNQNQFLLVMNQQQQELVAQQQQTICRLEAELYAYRSAHQTAFGLVHTN